MVSNPNQSRSRRPPAPLLMLVRPRPELPRPLRLEKLVTIIGSKEDADVCIGSQQVSGAHAVLVNRGNYVYVRDLVSRTGICVNGEPVEGARRLTYGDQLQIADVEFRFYDEGVFRFPSGRWQAAPAVFRVEGTGEEVRIEEPFFVIGRREGTDLALPHDRVSNAHAAIVELDGRWYVCDLNSRTGTTVNAVEVRMQEIAEGDVVGIGKFRLRCVSIETEDPAASADALSSSGYPSPTPGGDSDAHEHELQLADELPSGGGDEADRADGQGSRGGELVTIGGPSFTPAAEARHTPQARPGGERQGRSAPRLDPKAPEPGAAAPPKGGLKWQPSAAASMPMTPAAELAPPASDPVTAVVPTVPCVFSRASGLGAPAPAPVVVAPAEAEAPVQATESPAAEHRPPPDPIRLKTPQAAPPVQPAHQPEPVSPQVVPALVRNPTVEARFPERPAGKRMAKGPRPDVAAGSAPHQGTGAGVIGTPEADATSPAAEQERNPAEHESAHLLSPEEGELRQRDPWRAAHGAPELKPAMRRPVEEILADDSVPLLAAAPAGADALPPRLDSSRRRDGGRARRWYLVAIAAALVTAAASLGVWMWLHQWQLPPFLQSLLKRG